MPTSSLRPRTQGQIQNAIHSRLISELCAKGPGFVLTWGEGGVFQGINTVLLMKALNLNPLLLLLPRKDHIFENSLEGIFRFLN